MLITGLLRQDDTFLKDILENNLIENELLNITVLNAYLPYTDLSLPCLSFEHDMTYEEVVELGKLKKLTREYILDIFTATKGELQSWEESIFKLNGLTLQTGGKYIEIESLDLVAKIQNTKLSVPENKKYYYLDYNGSGYSQFDSYLRDPNNGYYVIDLDIEIPTQSLSSPITILDKLYDINPYSGIRLEIRNDNYLYVIVGLNTTKYNFTTNFTNYFNNRIRLTVALDLVPSRISCRILVNDVPIFTQTVFIFNNVFDIMPTVVIGANMSYTNKAVMKLYGLRIASWDTLDPIKYETPDRNGEYLGTSISDIINYYINEGKSNTVYNKVSDYSSSIYNMTLTDGCDWVLYLNDNSKNSTFHNGIYKMKLSYIIKRDC